MADLVLFDGIVTSGFVPSKSFAITARRVTLRWEITVSGAPASLSWYLEFGGDPTGAWFAETAEEDQGNGAVKMPAVVRQMTPEGGGNLPVGTTRLSTQFVREEQLARVQFSSSGSVRLKLTTPYSL